MKSFLLVLLALCPALAASQDKLKIVGIAPGEEVVVMLFGRTSAECMNGTSSPAETTFSTTGEKLLGNMLSKKKCLSEVAIFSKKHARKWQSLKWTDVPGEVHTIRLGPLIDAALNIWVTTDAQKAAAEEHAQKAQDLFIENRVGVRLLWKVRKLSDVPNAPSNAAEIVDAGINDDQFADCDGIARIRAQPSFYVAKTLNVYYVNKQNVAGRNCAIKIVPTDCPGTDGVRGDGNITFIGNLANSTTLAHELGHAYGLRPADCGGHTPDFPDNIMFPNDRESTVPRTHFTLGQVFRMNTHGDKWGGTMLIKNNLPKRVPRRCFPDDQPPNVACPTLEHPWP